MTYAIPKARTNYGIFNIRFQGAKVRNDISDEIKLLSLKRFKKKLKSIHIDNYQLQIYQHYIFLAFRCLILAYLTFFCCLSFSTSFYFTFFFSYFNFVFCVVCVCGI